MNRKSSSHAWLVLVVLTLVAAACTPASQPTPTANEAAPQPTAVPEYPDPTEINLLLPAFPDGSHRYYVELLEKVLTADGQKVNIQLTEELPQKRAVEMLDAGELSLMWLVQSAERDQTYTPVSVGLTNGLIGNRILLIRPGDQAKFENVQTLDDFRNLGLVGAFGAGWFDAKVWEANNLPFTTVDGEWRVIYGMLGAGDRGIDYFSRGFTEIRADAQANPELAIENRLVLVYSRDFRIYLSSSAGQYGDVLESALAKAQASGLMDELIRQYWGEDFSELNYDARLKIALETPQ